MIYIRKAAERGHFDHGWLKTFHTFSFADYHEPEFMGFRTLRVINEDFVEPGNGFPTHGHRDMEILTYVLEGELAHKDSMGNGSVIRPGELQRMSAGTGVRHSEYNASQSSILHLLQIWILPAERDITPGYEQKRFTAEERQNRLRLVASPDGQQGSLRLHQDVRLYSALLDPGRELSYALPAGRHAWLQVARGKVLLQDFPLKAGDGAAISDESELRLAGREAAEILLFDLN